VYGAFAGFPVFLLWIYVSWLIVLTGAVVTAALPALRTGVWARPNAPGVRLVGVLAMLRALAAAHALGETVDGTALARAARLTLDEAESRLERMTSRGWVARTENGRWVLARDPRAISLAECHDEFVWRDGALESFARTLGVGAGLPRLATREGGATTLEDLCRSEV
jgi:membrane protein